MTGENIAPVLFKWYARHHRNLPWRETSDPYAIWISEVILQQTRVNQGIEYYRRFLERFGTVGQLAEASEEEVLHLWQGLGYYSRARNLHAAARQIREAFPEGFPHSYEQLMSVKGIGEYTAAAVASIAFGLPHPVLDGNVYRVMARYLLVSDPVGSASGKKTIMEFLTRQLDHRDPGTFNQAVMELGALVCTPKNPACSACPLKPTCLAFDNGLQSTLPVRGGRRSPRTRYFHYTVPVCHSDQGTFTLLMRRGEGDIWQGLYEFPLIEDQHPLDLKDWDLNPLFLMWFGNVREEEISLSALVKHQLTHQTIQARFRIIAVKNLHQFADTESYRIVELNQLLKYPVSQLIKRFLSNSQIIKAL